MSASAALLRPAADPHAHLRQATHATHMRLHGLDQFADIASGQLPGPKYGALLGALHGYHSAISAAAVAGGMIALSSSPRRLTMLEADMAAMGVASRAWARGLPQLSEPETFGALYVAEGSALGGRVIARQLDYLFAPDAPGRTFFQGDADTARSWRRFLTALHEACDDEALFPELVSGAEASFALFEACVAS